jgi:tetratricopeptide (TPR) repeat protein
VAPGEQPIVSAYAQAAIPARYPLERREWSAAAVLPFRPFPEFRPAEGITHFARGLGAARTGNVAAAREEVAALQALEQALPPGQAYWAQLVKAQRLGVSAWIALAEGDTASALQLAADAADLEDAADKHPVTPGHVTPARELQADLLAQLNRYEDAVTAYEAVLRRDPNRARSLFGAAFTSQLAGNHEAAAEWYGRYLALMEKGDGDRPEIAAARTYLQGHARQP